jgi:hypothetical protein
MLRSALVALVAVCAVSAVATSTASAHVWTVCKETATGEFTEHLCKTKSEPAKTGKWEEVVLPVGEARPVEAIVVKPIALKAGTITITCEAVTIKEDVIENIDIANIEKVKIQTGRGKGTIELSKCKSSVAGCTVKEPIIDKGKESALVENTAETKIYDMFAPEAWKEEGTKAGAEKSKPFAKLTMTGAGCVNTEIEGDGIAAEIVPEGPSETKILKLTCPALTPVNLGNGVKDVGMKLRFFGVSSELCGELQLQQANKQGWGVQ